VGEVEQLALRGVRVVMSGQTRRDPDAVLCGPHRGDEHGACLEQGTDRPRCQVRAAVAEVTLQVVKPHHGAGRRRGRQGPDAAVNNIPVRMH